MITIIIDIVITLARITPPTEGISWRILGSPGIGCNPPLTTIFIMVRGDILAIDMNTQTVNIQQVTNHWFETETAIYLFQVISALLLIFIRDNPRLVYRWLKRWNSNHCHELTLISTQRERLDITFRDRYESRFLIDFKITIHESLRDKSFKSQTPSGARCCDVTRRCAKVCKSQTISSWRLWSGWLRPGKSRAVQVAKLLIVSCHWHENQ